MEMGNVCSFHYHVMKMVWCLVLSIFLLIEHAFFYIFGLITNFYIVGHFPLHTWYVPFVFWFFSQWSCELAQVIKCSTYPSVFLVILLSIMGFLPLWLVVCSFSFPFDLICFIAWLEVLIKWSFKFPYILINKLGKELERKSHTPTIGFNIFLWKWRVCM